MTLWQIAFKNIWQNKNRYLAYLGSAAFSVMIYFLYSALILHPQLQPDMGYYQAAKAVQGMRAAAVVIAIFTFLFLLYSNSAFIRSRMKEFGLLTMLGVSRKQLVQIILWESLCIATVALTVGLSLGLLFAKLFFMIISVLIQLPQQLPFYAGPPVWIQTLSVFGSFFMIVSLASLRSVMRRNIIELVRAGRQPKAVPTFSRWLATLGLVLVLGGYAWASAPNPMVIVFGIIPVTAMVSIGTLLVLREGSIALLHALHRRERLFYRPGPFLTISQLIYKMQDNYRVLSAVAILVAVIISAIGTIVSLSVMANHDTTANNPHAFQLMQSGDQDRAVVTGRINAVLRQHQVTNLKQTDIIAIPAQLGKREVLVVPYAFYASAQRPEGVTLRPLKPAEAILISPALVPAGHRRPATAVDDVLQLNGQTMPVQRLSDESGRILNSAGWAYTLVMADADHANIIRQTPAGHRLNITIWDTPAWKSAAARDAAAELRKVYANNGNPLLSSKPAKERLQMNAGQPWLSIRGEAYIASMSSIGLLLFIGFFVSLVFFAACCSLLYFRLFTEIDDNRRYFRQLQQVGVSNRELKQLVRSQTIVIFFVPFMTGLLHSTFAMLALGTLMAKTVLQLGWAVALTYLVLYTLFYGATYNIYWRSLRIGAIGRAEPAGI